MEFNDFSYKIQEENYLSLAQGGEREQHARTWLDHDTVDAWRHRRLHALSDPVINSYPQSNWLTVGDGRYGNDAHYLLQKGVSVVATDISARLLRESHSKGRITEYRCENAEALKLNDDSFDFVYCKESFHHFPRPMLALYEMLRVCRTGVILVEPKDIYVDARLATKLKCRIKKVVKWVRGGKLERHAFETAGNYVYALSRREIEKVALGMNYETVAFCGINDYYTAGVEYEKAYSGSALFRKVQRKIQWRDLMCRLRLTDYGLMASIIFKSRVDDGVLARLEGFGYDVIQLPRNPHLTCEATAKYENIA